MSGAAATITIEGTRALENRLAALAARIGSAVLLDAVGGVVETQTRRRLTEDKEGPDGEAWPEWSEAYAATRSVGQSLLEDEGHLVDSIHHMAHGHQTEIGSGLVQAAIQHFGGAEVGRPGHPARPFMGIGHDDEKEIEAVLGELIGGPLSGSMSGSSGSMAGAGSGGRT